VYKVRRRAIILIYDEIGGVLVNLAFDYITPNLTEAFHVVIPSIP
jgi:hypothetical protein